MKKITIIVALLLAASMAFALEVPTRKANQIITEADGNKFQLITWSLPTMYAIDTTGGGADTLNLITQSTNRQYFGNSKFTLFAKFTSDVDTAAIKIKLKVGVDSANYYWPVPDSSNRYVSAAGRLKQYTDLGEGDTAYTYTVAMIQAATTAGTHLAIPLNIPEGIFYKRLQIIFCPSGESAPGPVGLADTTKISEAFVLEKRPWSGNAPNKP